MSTPSDDLRYTNDHEWVEARGGVVRIGITDYAQDALGDVVYVDIPAIGEVVAAGASFGEIESTKSVSDLYAPVSGTVVAVNTRLADQPELVNTDPYGEGWICEIEPSDREQIAALLTAADYAAITAT